MNTLIHPGGYGRYAAVSGQLFQGNKASAGDFRPSWRKWALPTGFPDLQDSILHIAKMCTLRTVKKSIDLGTEVKFIPLPAGCNAMHHGRVSSHDQLAALVGKFLYAKKK